MIPQKTYDLVEKKLMDRPNITMLRQELQKARDAAYYPAGKSLDKTPVKRSRGGDKMAARVQRIMDAEKALADALSWEQVFQQVDMVLPNGTPEGEVAHMLFVERMFQADVCAQLNIDRQTVRRRKDAYICHCAIIAATRGLLNEEENEDGKQDPGQ